MTAGTGEGQGTGGRSLLTGILANADAHPEAVAVVVRERSISYGELAARARSWALAVLSALGRPARRVGVFAYRSEEAFVGVLAALASGAAFVPLNRNFPPARTRFMMKTAELDAVIVDAESAAQLPEVLSGLDPAPLVLFPSAGPTGVAGIPASVRAKADVERSGAPAPLPRRTAADLAYILFTSGSTGEPKGVAITDGNVLHLVDTLTRRYAITREDRFSQTFDQTFDPAIFDIFASWENGAGLYVLQPIELLVPDRFVRKHNLTVWCSVPSIPALMRKKNLLKPGSMPSLRVSGFGGEVVSEQIVRAWLEAAPNTVIDDLYGPTEAAVTCTAHRWDPATSPALCEGGAVPIGKALEGLTVAVVDEALRPVAKGEPGELLVSGPQVSPGYWRDEEKTAEKFIAIPAPEFAGMRFYRTGDRVKELSSGDLMFLGRIDFQLKILGHRVELGEIEAVLRQAGSIDQVVALGWPRTSEGADGVVAFVAGLKSAPEVLIEAARARLPEYMVPKEIIPLDSMPLTSSGKADRNALLKCLYDQSGGSRIMR